jgi:hypothetical protein
VIESDDSVESSGRVLRRRKYMQDMDFPMIGRLQPTHSGEASMPAIQSCCIDPVWPDELVKRPPPPQLLVGGSRTANWPRSRRRRGCWNPQMARDPPPTPSGAGGEVSLPVGTKPPCQQVTAGPSAWVSPLVVSAPSPPACKLYCGAPHASNMCETWRRCRGTALIVARPSTRAGGGAVAGRLA